MSRTNDSRAATTPPEEVSFNSDFCSLVWRERDFSSRKRKLSLSSKSSRSAQTGERNFVWGERDPFRKLASSGGPGRSSSGIHNRKLSELGQLVSQTQRTRQQSLGPPDLIFQWVCTMWRVFERWLQMRHQWLICGSGSPRRIWTSSACKSTNFRDPWPRALRTFFPATNPSGCLAKSLTRRDTAAFASFFAAAP